MNTVSLDVAIDEFERFCGAMDLDFDLTKMTAEEDRKSFEQTRDRVVRSIERGHLIINENGEPVFTPQLGDGDARSPITFHEPTGATVLAIDKAKKGQDAQKTFLMLADFTGQPVVRYAKMANRDFRVCQALMTLFLA
jgi:hypothetical protein